MQKKGESIVPIPALKQYKLEEVMITCLKCKKNSAASAFALCAHCLREYDDEKKIISLHAPVRKKFGLPAEPPRSPDGAVCSLCANNCSMNPGESGYCGIRTNRNGQLITKAPKGSAFAHMYIDTLPTNCCAAWFCEGSKERGYNLAVFMYGCNFDCLFCQNASHKCIADAPTITEDELVQKALHPHVRCICFFGGSPEPQLPFAIHTAERVFKESRGLKHICWEWNGSGNEELVKRASELSAESGGTVKFDLKAFHPHISYALCGVNNKKAFENFQLVAELFPGKDVLTATTLLVPYYVDKEEVRGIVELISEINYGIPYSLLVFHPDFYLDDLPVTPKKQVDECYEIARHYLITVNIGNRELLPGIS